LEVIVLRAFGWVFVFFAMWKTPFLYFFVHFHHTILAAALQGQQRTNIFLLCALFFPEVFDKNCSIVLFFLTAGYYSAILLLTLDNVC